MFSEIIHRTSNKILEQLNELVDWAKKQREKTSFNPEKLHLLRSINESLELLKTNAVQKEVTLKIIFLKIFMSMQIRLCSAPSYKI